MRAFTSRGLLLIAWLVPSPVVAAQSAAPAVVIRTTPATPARGALAWIDVAQGEAGSHSLRKVEGEAADEPLHFTRAGAGRFRALLALPVEGPDSIALSLRLERDGQSDTTVVTLAVTRPSYGTERLRVDPALARLDSAARVRVEAEQARSREVSRRAHDTPRLWTVPFELPRSSRITSVFGTAREYNGLMHSRHLGTDFAGAVGEPVRAAGRGVVGLVAAFYLAGNAVYLDHGAGLVTGYFHLSRIDVLKGDTVSAGQVIGAVGRSGRVTGPHLHWIARYGAVTVDPMSLVALDRETEEAAEPGGAARR